MTTKKKVFWVIKVGSEGLDCRLASAYQEEWIPFLYVTKKSALLDIGEVYGPEEIKDRNIRPVKITMVY